MEALVEPCAGTMSTGPLSQRSIYDIDRVKSSLNRIPTTPSFVAPTSLEREPSESLSTTTTTTTATEPAPGTSTAATSVLSLPRVFVIQKFHAAPSMPIDEKIAFVWARQIRHRLNAVLLHEIPKGTCLQEFMMFGKKANALKPTVVINCGDAETKKKVDKSLKNQGWLQDLVKANGIILIPLVTPTTLSAGPALSPTNTASLSECCSVEMHDSAATSCGLPLLVNASATHPQRYCTLGGLIIVNGEIFGLTAGHPFGAHVEHRPPQHEHDDFQGARLFEDAESSEASSEPFIFNDDYDGIDGDLSSTSTVSLHSLADLSSTFIDEPTHEQRDISEAFSPSVEWSQSFDAIIPLSTPRDESLGDCDWALLGMLPQSIIKLPNKIARIDSSHDILIERTFSGSPSGEVTIMVAGIGERLGYLHSSPATMKVDESVLNVQLITLERFLPPGSSGAWVILGEELCGFIVAIRLDVTWAYMVPIEPILRDIERKFGTTDVRLPNRGEIESLAASSKISETLAVIGEGDQILGSDGGKVSLPAAILENLLSLNNLPIGETTLEPPFETGNYPSNRQGVEIINEKHSILEKTPEVPMRTQFVPRLEPLSNMIEVMRPTSIRGSSSATVAPILPVPIEQLPRIPSPALIAPNPVAPNPGPPMPSLERGARLSSHEPEYTGLQKTIHASYKLWRGFETSLLRMEYRRALRRRRGLRTWFHLSSILRLPQYPRLGGGGGEGLQSAIAQDLMIAWYYVHLLIVAFWDVVLSFLYFVTCFPCRLWIVYRHRDVLEDEETLTRQRHESIEMLGQLPMEYRDAELVDQHRIRTTLTQLRGVGWDRPSV